MIHLSENLLQLRTERDQPDACGALRRADVALVAHKAHRPLDADQLALEVDVRPLQAEGFAAS